MPYTLVCVFCGKLHEASRPHKMTCSGSCRTALCKAKQSGDTPWSQLLPKADFTRVDDDSWDGSVGSMKLTLKRGPGHVWHLSNGSDDAHSTPVSSERAALAWARHKAAFWYGRRDEQQEKA